MFQLLKKYKKGVSPVIAIVLLIALTVAAAAVIWTLTSGILDDASGNTLVVSGSVSGTADAGRGNLTVSVNLQANSLTALNTVTLKGSSITLVGVTFSPVGPLSAGTTPVTITLEASAGDFVAGSYDLNLSWSGEGDDSKILEIPVTIA